jgi:hypothetical protein
VTTTAQSAPTPGTPSRKAPRKQKPATAPRLPNDEELQLRAEFEADREGFIDSIILEIARGMFDTVESSYHVRQLRDFGATDEGAAREFGTFYSLGTLHLSVSADKTPFLTAENATGLFFTLEAAEFGARLRRLVPFPQPVTEEERAAVMERRLAAAKRGLTLDAPEMVNRLLSLSGVKMPPKPRMPKTKKGARALFNQPGQTSAEEIGAKIYDFQLDTPDGEGEACRFALEVLTRRGISSNRPACLLRGVGQMIEHARMLYTSELKRAGFTERAEEQKDLGRKGSGDPEGAAS